MRREVTRFGPPMVYAHAPASELACQRFPRCYRDGLFGYECNGRIRQDTARMHSRNQCRGGVLIYVDDMELSSSNSYTFGAHGGRRFTNALRYLRGDCGNFMRARRRGYIFDFVCQRTDYASNPAQANPAIAANGDHLCRCLRRRCRCVNQCRRRRSFLVALTSAKPTAIKPPSQRLTQ